MKKNGKYCNKKSLNMKPLALLLALTLLLGCAIGGTLAWLISTDDAVVNTFTPSTINIELSESGTTNNAKSFKMIPGDTISKDPTVTVKAGSEACWLFVKVVESNDVDKFLDYDVITGTGGWTAVDGHAGYYYRQVDATTDDVSFDVIYFDANNNNAYDSGEEDKVGVLTTVTKVDMDALTANTYPKLTFMAAAIQSANVTTVTDAWNNLPATFNS